MPRPRAMSRAKEGFFDALGRWWDQSAADFDAGLKKMKTQIEETNDRNAKAARDVARDARILRRVGPLVGSIRRRFRRRPEENEDADRGNERPQCQGRARCRARRQDSSTRGAAGGINPPPISTPA